jgi:hypothetical protein
VLQEPHAGERLPHMALLLAIISSNLLSRLACDEHAHEALLECPLPWCCSRILSHRHWLGWEQRLVQSGIRSICFPGGQKWGLTHPRIHYAQFGELRPWVWDEDSHCKGQKRQANGQAAPKHQHNSTGHHTAAGHGQLANQESPSPPLGPPLLHRGAQGSSAAAPSKGLLQYFHCLEQLPPSLLALEMALVSKPCQGFL